MNEIDHSKLSHRGQQAFKAVDVLRRAREAITSRERWIQGNLFRPRDMNNPEMDTVCAMGAIAKVTGRPREYPRYQPEAVSALASAIYPHLDNQDRRREYYNDDTASVVTRFNDADTTSHADVLAAFDLAIEQECKVLQKEAKKSA